MSGICAVLRLDGRPAGTDEAAPILDCLAPRGPDGAAQLADGPIALGHALLASTPEALGEQMPLRHGTTGCIIASDARLDNREDLMSALGLNQPGRMIGDGALILEAYLKWGRDCPDRLLGDFAFIIWDPRDQALFAARDKVGMRQLTWCHLPGRLLACATDPEALLAHAEIPRRLNEGRVADVIEELEAIDHLSTFYRDVQRLPPAHAMTVKDGAITVWRYWELEPAPVIRRASDAAYEEAFLAVFTQAVAARLRVPQGRLGAMLSGGVDSGSVAVIAARLLEQAGAPPLRTFSGIDSDPRCKESACIRDTLAALPHIDPHIVSLADAAAFRDEVARLTWDESDPFDAHMALIRAIYLSARNTGARVMLDGVSGDTTLGTGNMVAHHIAHGRLHAAWIEARGLEHVWGVELKATRSFGGALRRRLTPPALRRWRGAAWHRAEAERDAATSLVDPALASRVAMPQRRAAHASHIAASEGCDPASQARRMLHPYVIVGRERYDRVAGAMGIEPRDPFLDVRLLAFCQTLPPEQLQRGGWAKLIVRRVMAGHLPDSVRWKRGRDHVGWRFIEECLNHAPDASSAETIAQLKGVVRTAPESGDFSLRRSTDGVVSVTDLFYLASWLTRFHTTGD